MSNIPEKARAKARAPEDLRQILNPSFEEARSANRQFVTSLARGLEVLSVFQPFEGPLSNQEIAARTALPKATISRITYTLTKLGYLEYVEHLERYRLGAAVLALGYAFRGSLEIRKLAKPHMEKFVQQTGATILLSAPYRLSFIVLDICAAENSMRLMLDVGSRIDVVDSMATAAYFEAIPEADERAIADVAEETNPEKWLNLQEELTRCREEVRNHNFCVYPASLSRNVNVCAATMKGPKKDKVFLFQAYAHNSDLDRKTFYDKIGPELTRMTEALTLESVNWDI